MNDLISRQDAVSRIADLLMLELQGKRIPTWDEVHNAMQDLPSANQWIPCSERLPEEYKVVLITILFRKAKTFNQIPYLRMAYYCNGFWHHIPQDNTMFHRKIEDFECGEPCVTAWMPLPQPWKEVEDE